MKKKMLYVIAIVVTFALFVPSVMAATKEVGTADELVSAISGSAAGDTIKLTSNIELSETITNNNNITIDLNGKVLSYETSVAGEAMLTNKGSLTITDSSDSADGKILFEYVGEPDTSYGKGNYTISNGGTLVVKSGIVENATAKMSHACYAIDNNSINSAASLTIDGGKVVNTYNYAIRQIAGTKQNTLTVNDGTVTGTRAVWIHLAGSDTAVKPNITLNVTGGNLIGTGESASYKLAVYSYSYGNSLENVKINISGGTLDGDVALSGGKNKTVSELVNITGGSVTDVYSYAEFENTRIEISGGEFSYDVSDYVVEGKYVENVGEIYQEKEYSQSADTTPVDPTEEVEDTTVGLTENEETANTLLESLDSVVAGDSDLEEAIKNTNVVVVVDVSSVEKERLDETVLSKIEELVPNATVSDYFDINVLINDEEDNTLGIIPELTKDIELVVILPEELVNTNKNVNRKYYIIREHDGEVEFLEDVKLSEDGKSIIFKSNKFSTYALAYEDVKVDNPDTGDVNLAVLVGTILVSLAGVAIVLRKRFAKCN